MSLYVLDTDILTLYQRRHPAVRERVMRDSTDHVAVSVISVEEQLGGWYVLLRRAKTEEQLIDAYSDLAEGVELLSDLRVLRFDLRAHLLFNQFRSMKIRIGTMDLRIAATVIAHDGILVTRNRRDFEQVPGLVFEDWSR